MDKKGLNIESAKVIYTTENTARHPLSGTVVIPALQRSMNYGWRKSGDVFEAAVVDIIAQPGKFLAYPCGKPFVIEGGKIVTPCGEVSTEMKDAGQLIDVPGIGKKLVKKFHENGVLVQGDLMSLDEPALSSIGVPPLSRKKILEWQTEKRLSR